MIHRALLFLGCIALLCVSSSATLAKKNNPNIDLEYVPQETVSEVQASLERVQWTKPVTVRFTDGRSQNDSAFIGIRTDDDDRIHELYATTEVIPFLATTVDEIFREWGVSTAEAANLHLELEVITYKIHEANQAVGANYESEVRLNCRLIDAGRELWAGDAGGGAFRYGKKFSNANVNEVLSDALLDALTDLMSGQPLQNAWAGTAVPKAAPTASTRDSVSPELLQAELKKLIGEQFEIVTIVEYLAKKKLSRPLTADDLAALKDSGVPETIIRTVVSLPVQ